MLFVVIFFCGFACCFVIYVVSVNCGFWVLFWICLFFCFGLLMFGLVDVFIGFTLFSWLCCYSGNVSLWQLRQLCWVCLDRDLVLRLVFCCCCAYYTLLIWIVLCCFGFFISCCYLVDFGIAGCLMVMLCLGTGLLRFADITPCV